MKKGVIITGGILIIVLLIFAGLLIFAKSYLTDERIKTLVIPKIEETLHRKVSVGDLKVSIFSGISLEDLIVTDRGGKGTFIKGKSLVLKYRILPLLRKKLVIEKITLISPEINIKKDREGRFNFDDLRGGPKKADRKEEPSSSGFSLLAQNIKIKDATFNLKDETGEIPDVKAAASADISIISTPSGKVSAEGSVDIKNIFVSYGELKPEVKGTLKFSDKDISMKMNVMVSNSLLEISGNVKNYSVTPSVSLNLSSEKIDLDSLLTHLNGLPQRQSKAKEKNNVGKTTPYLPEMAGSISLKNINYAGMNIGPVHLDYSVNRNKGRLKGFVSTDGGKVEIDVSGQKLTSSPEVDFSIKTAEFNADSLLQKLKQKDGNNRKKDKRQTSGKSSNKDLKPIPVPTNLKVHGTISADKLKINNVQISSLSSEMNLDRGVFDLKTFSGKISGGEFSARSRADLRDATLPYSKKLDVKDIDINALLKAFQPKVGKMIYGKGNLVLDIKGKGRTPELIKKSLTGKGNFLLKDGKFTGTELTKKLALFLGLSELETIPFDVSEGTMDMKNGLIKIQSSVKSPDLSMDPHGTINLPKDTLDIKMSITFSEELTEKLKNKAQFAKYLVGESKQGSLPLKVSGSLSSPKYGLDMEALAGRATKKVKKKVTDEIMKKLSGDDKSKEGEKNKKPSAGDFIKGIFGK